MSFTITKPLIDTLRADVELGRDSAIQGVLTDLHPADIAAVLDRLQLDEAVYVYRLLESEEAADVLLELNEDRREDLLNSLTSREIAEDVLEHIDSDDAADVMGDLSEDKQREVIALLEDQEQREDIEELLSYKEGTAGALMAKELVSVRTDWSVARAIVEMRRQAQEVDHVYTVYVVDKDERLAGILPLKDLLFGAESTRTLIKHLIEPEVVSVNTDTDVEEVVQRMKKYDAVVLPVVDTNGLLVGRITFDDVMDVMTEEAEEDYQLASGISEDVDATDSPLVQLRARLPWLLIGMVGGIVSSRIIAQYEGQLRIDPTMAFFMPLIAATAGNVGVQSSAIVVQGLASGSMGNLALLPRMWKELRVAVLSATVCAAVIFGINLALQQSQALTYTVSIALFSVILTAAMFGTVIPLLLNRLKVDPALATGPFVTTLNDIIGLLTYFTVGHFMYDLFP
ncbi:MAG: magnesium transporter [Flavobacteriales bacterium]|jgi:magnesium transporter|nr:magnesium transporter [Flavobacteriales bacterium]MBK6550581.1 magnesium transporter [Flavobacteriales bacterium]MBK6884808.1 magnesium transporter [Flavobacteriales bacterium]MBK7102130.1 magnesium transporter [Flavobacteriales bacterium]MBK7112600.1 magnesium transporter [Flavobacteriales bacterium]